MPPELRRRLRPWLDIDSVGPEGFWIWLRAVLPLLPRRDAGGLRLSRRSLPGTPHPLEAEVAESARERTRLAVLCERYARDNDRLTRRLQAAESALRTLELAEATGAGTPEPGTGAAARRLSVPAVAPAERRA